MNSPLATFRKWSRKMSKNASPVFPIKQPEIDVPDMFLCPISMEIMKEPQISRCGHLFDRDSILKWLKGEYDPDKREVKRGCPVCHQDMDLNSLGPCYPIKKAIDEYLLTQRNSVLDPVGTLSVSDSTNNSNGSNQTLSSQQSGISFESSGTNRIEPIHESEDKRPRSASSLSRFKDTIVRKMNGDGGKIKKRKMWCTLTPVVEGTFDKIHVTRDEFQIGRNPGADHVIKLQEVSHFHCKIRRRKQNSTGKYEIIIEDGSTNGTFINGQKVGKTNLNSAYHGDCISIGRKFLVEKDVPILENWIDWVFVGSSDIQEHPREIEKLKKIDRFDTLLQYNDSDYSKMGIQSESIINTVTLALKAWRYDHRFPSFFIEVMTPELYLNNPQGQSPLQKYIEMVANKSGRSSNSDNTVSTVNISPVTSATRERFSTAPTTPSIIIPDRIDKTNDTSTSKSRLSKHSSASSKLESLPSSPTENGYQYESSTGHTGPNSRKQSKDIIGEIFTKEKNQYRGPKVVLCGEIALHEKMCLLYPMLHTEVVDVVIDYEKQVFGKENLDPDEMPILEKRCRRKLDELTARKAKIMYSHSQESLGSASQKSTSTRP